MAKLFDKETKKIIKQVIRENFEKKDKDIAVLLNSKHIKTTKGRDWTSGNVANQRQTLKLAKRGRFKPRPSSIRQAEAVEHPTSRVSKDSAALASLVLESGFSKEKKLALLKELL
jgi:hypothetical protein